MIKMYVEKEERVVKSSLSFVWSNVSKYDTSTSRIVYSYLDTVYRTVVVNVACL